MLDFNVDFRTIILAVIAVVNYVLGVSILLSGKQRSSKFFFYTTISVVVWTIGINLYIQPGVSIFTYFFSAINYSAAACIGVFFFYFAYFFNQEDKAVPRTLRLISCIGLAIIILLIVSPGLSERLIVKEIYEERGGKVEVYGALYPLFVFFIAGNFFAGLGVLLNKFRKASGVLRTQLGYITFGTGLSIFSGITTNIVLPNLDVGLSSLDWLGPTGTFIMIIFVFIAIRKHSLWNFKLIAIEVFTSLMSIILILQILFSTSTEAQIAQIITFITMLAFSYFLIKGLLHGVETREKMEKLANSLRLANEKLQEIDSEKSDFVSITSHQFRTPLTVIKGYTSMLLEGSYGSVTNKEQYHVLEQIFRASQRLVLLIEDFLNISRLEKGEMHYVFKPVDLRKLLSENISQFKITIKEERIRFTFNADLGETYVVRADENKIQQVIRNVIDNAIKYTSTGGEITITLSRMKKDGLIRVAVADNGIGIQSDMMNRLFEKFSRAKGISRLHTEGRGLGLYISKQIIAAHGGRIWAESRGKP